MSSSALGQRAKDKQPLLAATFGLVTEEQEVSSGLGGSSRARGGLSQRGFSRTFSPILMKSGCFPVVPGTLPLLHPCRLPPLPAARHPSEGHGRAPGLATLFPHEPLG